MVSIRTKFSENKVVNGLKRGVLTGRIALFSMLFVIAAVQSAQAQSSGAPQVTTFILKAADLPLPLEYPGQTDGSKHIEIRSRVKGILEKRTYTEGTFVTKGQSLFQIDPSQYKADLLQAQGKLAQAQANLTKTRSDYERNSQLYQREVISKKEYDDTVAAYQYAQADVEANQGIVDLAKINLNWTNVEAPISGITSKEAFSEGSLIEVNGLLTTLVQVNPLYVNFSIADTEAMRIRTMVQKGKITVPANLNFDVVLHLSDGSEYSQHGKINFIDSTADPNTSTIKARAEFPNEKLTVLPGQFVRVTLNGTIAKNALRIPQKAILSTQQGSIVYIVDEKNIAKSRVIEIGGTYGSDSFVTDGVKDGEKIVLDGIQRVQDGQPVNVTSQEDPYKHHQQTTK